MPREGNRPSAGDGSLLLQDGWSLWVYAATGARGLLSSLTVATDVYDLRPWCCMVVVPPPAYCLVRVRGLATRMVG